MKKIMILTAERTGTGHKASANALQRNFENLGYQVKQVNCFALMGKRGEKMENCYIPLTTKHPYLWKIAHDFSDIFPNAVHGYMYNLSKSNLLKEIEEFKPDLIISVHCMFTRAVSKLIKKNNLNIPFAVVVIDLINPPRVWRDKSADFVFVPTEKVKDQYVKLGFDKAKLIVSGFPIREDIISPDKPKEFTDTLNVLMVNPSVNLNKNREFASKVGNIENVKLSIVCGRDERMYNALMQDKQNGKINKDVEIMGFVSNMDELLASAHLILTKAGPNILLESTRSGTAVIVTGHIPGQEGKNYQYITENGLGLKCENPNKIVSVIENLMDTKKINEFLQNCLNSKYNDGAKIISKVLIDNME